MQRAPTARDCCARLFTLQLRMLSTSRCPSPFLFFHLFDPGSLQACQRQTAALFIFFYFFNSIKAFASFYSCWNTELKAKREIQTKRLTNEASARTMPVACQCVALCADVLPRPVHQDDQPTSDEDVSF